MVNAVAQKWQGSPNGLPAPRLAAENPADFTGIHIDQLVLDGERQFQVRQRPLDQLVIQVNEEEERSDIELLAPSVASLDSIAQDVDFIAF
jgi:hypothetical protein